MTVAHRLHTTHARNWRANHYVYPVLSRRAHGLSIGVNLNPDKVCNWDCVYCQVDRTTPGPRADVDLIQLRAELDAMLTLAQSGEIWSEPEFHDVPATLRRINDIAFSGDGEPTTCPGFEEAVRLTVDLKSEQRLADLKLIVLTNMTMAHRENVKRAFAVLDKNNGEVWAKLEAGTEAFYKLIDRSAVPFDRVLSNIREAARLRPVVIQSLFMRIHGEPIPPAEFDAYLDRLAELAASGSRFKLVQLYTIARQTSEKYATPLSDAELDALAARFRARFGDTIPCEVFYGTA